MGRYIRSSLQLEILMYLNRFYLLLLFVLSVITFAYKDWKFPYPENYLGLEIATLVFYFFEEIGRLFIGTHANKTENPKNMALFTLLAIGALMLNVYFMNWQTFVLKIDLISHSIAVGMIALQVLLGAFYMLAFMVVEDDLEEDERALLR
mmetsp:Transcript_10297/g.16541  ORF Transcript_10297/g.16541 Transcript_10297/m.16541 type:complete len:150 (+) Transcript_10297:69-518(+)